MKDKKISGVFGAASAVLAVICAMLIVGLAVVGRGEGTVVFRLGKNRIKADIRLTSISESLYAHFGKDGTVYFCSDPDARGDHSEDNKSWYSYMFTRKLSREEAEKVGYDREDFYEVTEYHSKERPDGYYMRRFSFTLRYSKGKPVGATYIGKDADVVGP